MKINFIFPHPTAATIDLLAALYLRCYKKSHKVTLHIKDVEIINVHILVDYLPQKCFIFSHQGEHGWNKNKH